MIAGLLAQLCEARTIVSGLGAVVLEMRQRYLDGAIRSDRLGEIPDARSGALSLARVAFPKCVQGAIVQLAADLPELAPAALVGARTGLAGVVSGRRR